MNSENTSPEQAIRLCGEIKLTIHRKVPSWNIILKMSPWERSSEKRDSQMALLDAIKRAIDLESSSPTPSTSPDLLTRKIARQNFLQTAYDTLLRYEMTDHKTSTSGLDKSKLLRDLKKKLKLRLHQRNQNKTP